MGAGPPAGCRGVERLRAQGCAARSRPTDAVRSRVECCRAAETHGATLGWSRPEGPQGQRGLRGCPRRYKRARWKALEGLWESLCADQECPGDPGKALGDSPGRDEDPLAWTSQEA
eukprot:1190366-Alexandrium_andersonii.AAC.1